MPARRPPPRRRTSGFLNRLVGGERLPEPIFRKLVATLYSRWEPVVLSFVVNAAFGLICFAQTSSGWYLIGVAYAAIVAYLRVRQFLAYVRTGGAGSPATWAIRNLVTGWATALGWAGWTAAIHFEPNPSIGASVLALLASLICGGAIRSSGVPAAAYGQIAIPIAALVVACLASDDAFLRLDAPLVLLLSGAVVVLTRSVHKQSLELLLAERQASDLAAELALINQHLSEQAATDPLTHLMNRRALDLAASREWLAAARDRRPTSVLMLDIDHFKSFNDHYGHQAGDQCLRDVAAVLAAIVRRPTDILARYGGEEFIAVLPAVDAQGAATVAANILDELAAVDIPHPGSPFGRVTASLGIACSTESDAKTIADLIAEADAALYRAKRDGRNQISAHREPHPA